ncbi:MAG: 30S ribosomal protein S2 [Candidatus Harrisonbacteria bacterium]|nr:30S ribosomal protein S2 [Candidatus Harrisonbacteria bacterium]
MTDNTQDTVQTAPSPQLQEMAEAGLLFGRKKSQTNPKMKPFICANRGGFELFDLEKTKDMLEKAQAFIEEAAKGSKPILFVATHPASQGLVEELAKKFSYPYVTLRWLGGTLTNFDTIQTRLKYYLKLKSDQATGKLLKYTKKEQVKFSQELERLERLFGGLEKLDQRPAALFVVNANLHKTAIREATQSGIPVVAIATTSADPVPIDYLIPANDSARKSISWILDRFTEVIENAKKK